MKSWKLGFASILVLSAFASSAQAQSKKIAGGYNPYGVNGGVYGSTSGFGNFGGAYSGYGFNGGSGYGAGAVPYFVPQTYNNLGGLAGTIRQQTGRPNSYRSGAYNGVSGRRGR